MLAKRRNTQDESDIGRLIRMRRMELKISQTELANTLGVTFQQVQKYEKGTNRVSASRLQRIADYFEVPITYFLRPKANMGKENAAVLDFLASAYSFRLLQAFSKIADKKIQQSVVTLVEEIAAGHRSLPDRRS